MKENTYVCRSALTTVSGELLSHICSFLGIRDHVYFDLLARYFKQVASRPTSYGPCLQFATYCGSLTLTNEILQRFACARPHSVDLMGCTRLTGAGLVALKDMRLKQLDLSAFSASARIASGLNQLPHAPHELESLDLDGAHVRTEDMRVIGGFTNLTSLDLEDNGLIDTDIAHLQGLSRLRWLCLLGNRRLGNDALLHLQRLPLTDLSLCKTSITDAGLQHIACLSGSLTSIDLSSTAVTNEGLAQHLSKCKLRFLGVAQTRVALWGCFKLEHIKDLQNLRIGQTMFTYEGAPFTVFSDFTMLAVHCPALTHLSLHGRRSLGPEHFQALSALSALTALDLTQCGLDAPRLQHVSLLSNLKYLSVEDESASCLKAFSSATACCPSLTKLTLRFNVFGDALKNLSHINLPALTALNFNGCATLYDGELAHVARLTLLRELDLMACVRLSAATGVLLAKLPSLCTLYVDRTNIARTVLEQLAPDSNLQLIGIDNRVSLAGVTLNANTVIRRWPCSDAV